MLKTLLSEEEHDEGDGDAIASPDELLRGHRIKLQMYQPMKAGRVMPVHPIINPSRQYRVML
jgi:hypothetical protein